MAANELSPASLRLRKALLGGVSALPLAYGALAPHAALAGPAPATCAPTISTFAGGPFTLSGACTITSAGNVRGTTALITSVGTISSLTNSGTISATHHAVDNLNSTITTLDNLGFISSKTFAAIDNNGSIGALTNSGTIVSTNIAVSSQGQIGTLANTGLIRAFSGINNSGSIGTLSNSGTIHAIGSSGIYNLGQITTLTNSGVISGGAGVSNYGTIGQFTNQANSTISGVNKGLYNDGTISTLTNSGKLTGGSTVIANSGSINSLSNTGTITNIGATVAAIYNDSTIGTFNNSGLIANSGFAAIANLSHIGSIINLSGGTINGGSFGIDTEGGGNIGPNPGFTGAITNNGFISGRVGVNIAPGTVASKPGGIVGTLTNTGIIQGVVTGVINRGTLYTLTNSGTISGSSLGVFNPGLINSLSNSGTIHGASSGIYTKGQIGTLTNSGIITGNEVGISNQGTIDALSNLAGGTVNSTVKEAVLNSDTIGTLDNQGFIVSNSFTAIDNNGTIGALTNSGVISGSKAIFNSGTIGGLTNSGTISGGSYGINNNSSIVTLDNLGVIVSANNTAIYNGVTIGALTNSGTINGFYGISNSGTIGALTNDGVISGVDAIANNGTIGALINNGTISGTSAIDSSGAGLHALTNTGLISGNINIASQGPAALTITGGTGPVFGRLSGGTISMPSGSTLTFAGGNQILTDNVNLGTGTMINNDPLQIGTPGSPATVNLTGNFVQGANGTLIIPVTPTISSVLNVTGNASLNGNVTYDFAPGTYTPKTYKYLNAGSVTGTFSSVSTENFPTGAATLTQYPTAPGAELTFTRGGAIIVTPANDSLFGAQTEALATTTQTDMGLLMGAAAQGGSNSAAACAAAAQTAPSATSPGGVQSAAQVAGTLGNAFCGAGGWIEATGSLMDASHSNGSPGYHADGGGFLAGIDRVFGALDTRLGFALGYDQTRVTTGGGSGSASVVRVALYGAQPLGPVTLSGVISYGNASNSTSRASGFGSMSEHYNDNIFSGGAQASTNVALGPLALTPAGGVRVADIEGAHFAEQASGLAASFAVSGSTQSYTSVQPFATVSLSHQFLADSQMMISTDALVGYEYQAGDQSAVTLLSAADGTRFHVGANRLDRGDALVGLDISANKDNWSMFANYGARVAGNWTAQTAEVGVRISF